MLPTEKFHRHGMLPTENFREHSMLPTEKFRGRDYVVQNPHFV